MTCDFIHSEDLAYWYKYSDSFWKSDGTIRLPRSPKVYFDYACHEAGVVDRNKKFLELGWCLWNNLDLYAIIKSWLDARKHIVDYERDVKTTIALHIENLRSGNKQDLSYELITTPVIGGKPVKELTLKEVVRLFSNELLLRYQPYSILQCYWDYDKIIEECKTDEELVERLYSPTPESEILSARENASFYE